MAEENERQETSGRRARSTRARVLLYSLAAMTAFVGYSCYQWKYPEPGEAFASIFGMPVPDGVKELTVRRSYAGGPGDSMTFIHFFATPEAMAKLTAGRKLENEPQILELYAESGDNWCQIWSRVFGSYLDSAGPSWSCPATFPRPAYFSWDCQAAAFASIQLMWSQETGEVFALYLVG